MKPVLTSFFITYPIQGDLKLALEMVKKNIHLSIEDLDEDSDDYMKHLSDAYRMLEAIYTELGIHPDSYK